MAEFNITKVEKDPKGKIYIKSGKITYAFGDIEMLREMVNRPNPKPQDIGLQKACEKVLQLNPEIKNPVAIENIKVLY